MLTKKLCVDAAFWALIAASVLCVGVLNEWRKREVTFESPDKKWKLFVRVNSTIEEHWEKIGE